MSGNSGGNFELANGRLAQTAAALVLLVYHKCCCWWYLILDLLEHTLPLLQTLWW
jgi:hypothetical protein